MTHGIANPLTGRHVLRMILAFFGVTLAVNGVFIFLAITTFSGQTSRNPYGEGLHYNTRIAAAQAQAINGLRHQTVLGSDGVRVSLMGGDNHPASGLIVVGGLVRPVSSRSDRDIVLTEQSSGDYRAVVSLAPGAWILEITARREASGPVLYQSKERLWLTPQR